MHLLHHIVDSIALYGPVYSTWMFAYERFNSWISRRITNQRHPEATVMETYWVGTITHVCVHEPVKKVPH